MVSQTSHQFAFWYEAWDSSTTPDKLQAADVIIGILAQPTTTKSQSLAYVTYYQDRMGGDFINTADEIPLVTLQQNGVVQPSAFTSENPGWDVLCDNSLEMRRKAFDQLTRLINRGYEGLFVDNAADKNLTCTAPHAHLHVGERSDDSYLVLLRDIRSQLNQLSTTSLLIANAGNITTADSLGTGANTGAMWTVADFVLWESYGYTSYQDSQHDQLAATIAKSLTYAADATKAAKTLALSYPRTQQEALLSFALARMFGFAWTANLGVNGLAGHWGVFAPSMPWTVGAPRGNLYLQGALVAREFSNGVVFANTGATAVAINIPQSGTFVTASGKSSATADMTVSVEPKSAAVLLFQ